MANTSDTILTCSHLFASYTSRNKNMIPALDDVSFSIKRNETVGLVGESGCGKSTLSRVLLRLQKADSGSVVFEGTDVLQTSKKQLHMLRQYMQIVFQDPYASLDPTMKIGEQVREGLDVYYSDLSLEQRNQSVCTMLQRVGLKQEHFNRYPSSLSGGQLQRVAIAQALILQPRFLICDEPVSALDVSVQAQILNLLKAIQQQSGLSYLFISHNIHVVYYMSDTIAVMYAGRIVELGAAQEIALHSLHPYTKALHKSIVLKGDVGTGVQPYTGCPFADRCPIAKEVCYTESPKLVEYAPNHQCACHFAGQM